MKKIILLLTALALISCGGSSSRSSSNSFTDNDDYDDDDDYGYTTEYEETIEEPTGEETEEVETFDCNNCGGSGQVSCMNCGGQGYALIYNPYIGGPEVIDCGLCGGEGHFNCAVCGGDGYVEKTHYEPVFKSRQIRIKVWEDLVCPFKNSSRFTIKDYYGQIVNVDSRCDVCHYTLGKHYVK